MNNKEIQPTSNENRLNLIAESAPTLAQRLGKWGIDFTKDFGGLFVRMNMYIIPHVLLITASRSVDIQEGIAYTIGLSSMVGSMALGELYAMDRLAKRLPWLETNRTRWRSYQR